MSRRWTRRLAALPAGLLGLLLLFSAPASADSTVAPPGSGTSEEVGLQALGLGTQTVYGVSDSVDVYFPRPVTALAATGNFVHIFFAHSPLLHAGDSSVTILVNNNPITALPLNDSNVNAAEAIVEIPAQFMHSDQVNLVSARFQMRTNFGQCDPQSHGLYARLDRQTFIHYQLATNLLNGRTTGLETYPFPLISSAAGVAERPLLALPPSPRAGELAAALQVIGSLGQRSNGEVLPVVVTSDHLARVKAAQATAIVVGAWDRMPLAGAILAAASFKADGDGYRAADGARAGNADGLIVEEPAPWDPSREVLFVTGSGDAGVAKAAAALASQGSIAMAGSYAVVRSLTTTTDNQPANGTAQPGRAVSLASLGRDDIEIAGVGDHSSTVSFIAPPVDRAGFGFVNLVISHSALLSNGNSAVTAQVNGNRVGTVLLDAANEQGAPLQFRFSGLLLRPGVNTLTLSAGVAVSGGNSSCVLPNDDQLWVSFSRGSTLQLPGRSAPGVPALETLPYPFLDAADQGVARLVLADDSEPVLTAAAGTVAALGSRAVNTPGALDVVYLKDLKDAGGGDRNLIIIGVSGSDERLAIVGRKLRVQVGPGSIQVQSPALGIDGQLLNEGSLGVIEELPVPGSNGHSAIWLSATRPEMLPIAVRALYDRGLSGVVVTVDQAGRTRTFQLPGASTAALEALEVRIVRFALLALAVGALVLVGVQIWRPREREET